MSKKLKIALSAASFAVISAVITLVAFAVLYPYATVSFSGIHMVINDNGTEKTTQGFIDVTLKNIDSIAVSYCLEYDTSLMQLSKVSDNTEITNVTPGISGSSMNYTSYDLQHEYFDQNLADFPTGVFADDPTKGVIGPRAPIIGIADPANGYVIMNFTPDIKASPCPAIGMVSETDDNEKLAILAASTDMLLGRISFKIKDPATFSKLTESQLKNAIKIVPYSSMKESYTARSDEHGVYIMYIDENGDETPYTDKDQNVHYDFNIKPDLVSVKPLKDSMTVNSYEIYKTGTSQDLLDFLNEKMSTVILEYTDSSKVPANFEWTAADSNISSITWDPQGDKMYTITQPYSVGVGSISVTVTVSPVNLTGFSADNTTKTYYVGQDPFPSTVEDLELAWEAHPVFDTYIPNFGIDSVPVSWYSEPPNTTSLSKASSLTSGFDTTPASHTFIGNFDTSVVTALPSMYPWLTIGSIGFVSQIRNVVATANDMPKQLIVTSSVDDSGFMTIKASYPDVGGAVDPIPAGTTFRIKMPNGEFVDTVSLGSQYSVNIITDSGDPDYGKAIITLSPTISIPSQQKLAQYINIGNRAEGKFSVAATESGGTETEFTDFTHEPRNNYYEKYYNSESLTYTDYTFDYSTSLSQMFRVKAGSTLPTTVTLFNPEDYVSTTYDGETGLLPGKLSTITVDSWSVEDGNPAQAGSAVTVKGKLADISYTNYGKVINNTVDPVYVIIKYYVVDNDGEDRIDAISDFAFDKQQEGYGHDLLQSKEFTINNSGPKTIYGLSVTITPNGSDPEAFILTKSPKMMIDSGDTDTFEIMTKPGLPARDGDPYKATVSVLSNNKVLRTFTVSFEVTSVPIYHITLTIPTDQQDLGKAKTSTETYTSEEGKVIKIIAEPEDDCKFIGWTVESPSGLGTGFFTYEGSGQETATFVMPNSDITIKAEFEETPEAMLRAAELMVRPVPNPSASPVPADVPPFSDTGYPLYDVDSETGIWNKVSFDPVKREYYLAIPASQEEVKLWFKLRTKTGDTETTTVELTQEHDPASTELPTATTLPTPVNNYDDYYDSDPIKLIEGPTANVVKLKLSRTGASDRYYTLNIYRQVANNAEFKYGNSPYGLIMRDDTTFPDAASKLAAKQEFNNNDNTFTAGYTPSGGDVGTHYTEEAWGVGVNYDKDDYALFIITSSAFKDPGYDKLKNSIGEEVTTGITKKITVNKLTDTTHKDGSPDDFVYAAQQEVILTSDTIDLSASVPRIRPDKYNMVYSFTDFDGSTKTVTRPVIVLSPLGDVNIDNVVKPIKDGADSDEDRIINRFKTELADETNIPIISGVPPYDVGGLLFKYRVCDTTKDGVINAIDANPIYALGLSPPIAITPFYRNLN